LLPPIFFYCVYGARPGLIISLLLPVIVAGMWLAHDRFGIAFPDHFSYINTDLSMTLAIAPVYLVVVFIVAVYESANRKLSHLLDAERTHHARLAFLDPLTNLDNSRAFVDRLNSAASPHNGQTSPIAVICCDIDDLKPINDTFGHANGDQVLIAVGERLKSAVRSQFDLVARVGGDEFAILLPSCPETEIDSVIHRIRARMSEPLIINDQTITIQVSIGAATGLPGETDPFEIVKRADAAMYRNKAASKQSRLALGEERADP
jgi:diguanylate cyclase (GGDEF)-like protein